MASHVSTGSEEGEEVMVGQSVWADLPSELLERIVNTLDPLDRVAVRLVCASWRAACVQEFSFPFEIPRLLIRRPERGGELVFFSVQDARILPFALPTWLRASRCCGHVTGWLVMAFDSERRIKVCNPVLCRYADISYPPMFEDGPFRPTNLPWVGPRSAGPNRHDDRTAPA
ncbi:hypothetical protein PR202_ga14210 [Eleusine coracana subsp. coracana]|uniref:F-box domain-containing protein n=1 Tax=Eleusine coracana subsp. coracana TaxID=191504 RepID=A0AAV5CGZ3_ELECO|nr:hypothetical protein PR202_ga14210 [Eleusine coracana subsp. coracana]